MTLKRIMSLVSLAGLAGCASTGAVSGENAPISDDVKAELAAFERTGEKVSCIGLRRIQDMKPLDDYRLLVRSGNDYYLNELSGRCSNAASGFTRLEYKTSLSQLCRNEILNVVDNSQGFVVGSCGVGDFERLEKIETDAQ